MYPLKYSFLWCNSSSMGEIKSLPIAIIDFNIPYACKESGYEDK